MCILAEIPESIEVRISGYQSSVVHATYLQFHVLFVSVIIFANIGVFFGLPFKAPLRCFFLTVLVTPTILITHKPIQYRHRLYHMKAGRLECHKSRGGFRTPTFGRVRPTKNGQKSQYPILGASQVNELCV